MLWGWIFLCPSPSSSSCLPPTGGGCSPLLKTLILLLYILVCAENQVPVCRHWGLWVPASSLHLHSPTSSLCPTKTHLCLPSRSHQGKETQHRLKVGPPSCGRSHNLALRCLQEPGVLQCGCLQSRTAPSLVQRWWVMLSHEPIPLQIPFQMCLGRRTDVPCPALTTPPRPPPSPRPTAGAGTPWGNSSPTSHWRASCRRWSPPLPLVGISQVQGCRMWPQRLTLGGAQRERRKGWERAMSGCSLKTCCAYGQGRTVRRRQRSTSPTSPGSTGLSHGSRRLSWCSSGVPGATACSSSGRAKRGQGSTC